jgi:hypothetical protein
VRLSPADDAATAAALARGRRLLRWASRSDGGHPRLNLRAREGVELAELSDYGGFGEGWSYPDERGLWTQGSRSELALALEGGGEGNFVLALSLDSICVRSNASLNVEALINGKSIAARHFSYGDPDWHIELPGRMLADGQVDLSFETENPSSPVDLDWSDTDDRRLGILLRSVTLLGANDEAAREGLARERRLRSWAARGGEAGTRRLHIPAGEVVELADLSEYGGFGEGWRLYPDQAGIWTEGSSSELALALEGMRESDYLLELSLGSICVAPDASLRVDTQVNGEPAAAGDLGYGESEWRVELPEPVSADGAVDLTLTIENLSSPVELGWSSDDRQLGILLRAITLVEVDRSLRPGETIVFSEGSGGERFLGEGWSMPDETGVWTDGDKASLLLRPTDIRPEDGELVLAVSAFVTTDHPNLEVEVSALDEPLARRVFRHGEALRLFHIPFPAAAGAQGRRMLFELRLSDPARPLDLGLSEDARRLGVRLEWLMVRQRTLRATLSDAIREKSANLRSRLRPSD